MRILWILLFHSLNASPINTIIDALSFITPFHDEIKKALSSSSSKDIFYNFHHSQPQNDCTFDQALDAVFSSDSAYSAILQKYLIGTRHKLHSALIPNDSVSLLLKRWKSPSQSFSSIEFLNLSYSA